PPRDAPVVVAQRRLRSVQGADQAGDALRNLAGGQRVAGFAGHEVPRVACSFAETVRRLERRRIVAVEQPGCLQTVEGLDGCSGPDLRPSRAVFELQELDGELDVAQRSLAELEVELRVLSR